MNNFNEIPVVNFTEPNTYRLIPTAYINEPALTPLADDEIDLGILEELEMKTSTRHQSFVDLPIGIDPNELVSESFGFGWTYINAAFCYTRVTGNRFNTNERGAWYASFGEMALETSKAEVSYHLSNELINTNTRNNITSYKELISGFTSEFHDLTNFKDHDCLSIDINVAYSSGQQLAKDALSNQGSGIIYPSARMNNGQCIAVFRPHLIQNIRHGDTWIFKWEDSYDPVITQGK